MTAKRRRNIRPENSIGGAITFAEIGQFAWAMTLAQRELASAAQTMRDEFTLGPRAPWIIGLIASGSLKTQADVVKLFKVARSMIAEEIALLTRSGLVEAAPNATDRRQVDLKLTALGHAANEKLGEAMKMRLQERLGANYSLQDLKFCTDLLSTLAGSGGAIVECEADGRWSRPLRP